VLSPLQIFRREQKEAKKMEKEAAKAKAKATKEASKAKAKEAVKKAVKGGVVKHRLRKKTSQDDQASKPDSQLVLAAPRASEPMMSRRHLYSRAYHQAEQAATKQGNTQHISNNSHESKLN